MAKMMSTRWLNFEKGSIKHEADRLLLKDYEIKNTWKEYFDKLFNDDSEKIAIELDDSVDANR
jgi:hypothetical protein